MLRGRSITAAVLSQAMDQHDNTQRLLRTPALPEQFETIGSRYFAPAMTYLSRLPVTYISFLRFHLAWLPRSEIFS